MRKTFFTLIALLMSLTTVNAQMLTPDGSITVTRQRTAVINKHMAPAMGPNRIAMDADERIMGGSRKSVGISIQHRNSEKEEPFVRNSV